MEIGFLCHGEFETLKWAYVELLGTAPSMSQINFPLRNYVAYLSMWNQMFKNKITDNGEMFKIFDFLEGRIYTKHLHKRSRIVGECLISLRLMCKDLMRIHLIYLLPFGYGWIYMFNYWINEQKNADERICPIFQFIFKMCSNIIIQSWLASFSLSTAIRCGISTEFNESVFINKLNLSS